MAPSVMMRHVMAVVAVLVTTSLIQQVSVEASTALNASTSLNASSSNSTVDSNLKKTQQSPVISKVGVMNVQNWLCNYSLCTIALGSVVTLFIKI